jgi:transcription elongation factor GreB
MSKAFLRESDFADIPDLPQPVSALPPGAKNYVTARGSELLRTQLAQLLEERPPLLSASAADPETKRELQALDQRIRYLRESLRTAEIVPAPADHDDVVRFGAAVRVREINGEATTYRLVGVDEADPERGWISWTSPLARALLNGRLGQHVTFVTPLGPKELEIVGLSYASDV